jgi:hypothetical protein
VQSQLEIFIKAAQRASSLAKVLVKCREELEAMMQKECDLLASAVCAMIDKEGVHACKPEEEELASTEKEPTESGRCHKQRRDG